MNLKSIVNYLGYLVLVVILVGSGFYFGYKNAEASLKTDSTSKNVSNALAKINSSQKSEVKILEVEGAFWLKNGQDPICPATHPVKGKFDSKANVYYLPENKFYNRSSPDICFASEEYARDKAGFLKKT